MKDLQVENSGYVTLRKVQDCRDGTLVIAEAQRDIPFDIKRVYYIKNLENSISQRGRHAHRKLFQVIFCISGSFILSLDDGMKKQELMMNKDNIGVVLGPMLWHEMRKFTSGCVLLVFASDYYDELDYIRNYNEFLKLYQAEVQKKKVLLH